MGYAKVLVVLLTIALVQFTSALTTEELHEKLKAIRPETLEKLKAVRNEALEKLVAVRPEALKKLKASRPEALEKLKAVRPEILEKLKAVRPRALEKLASKVSQNMNQLSSIDASLRAAKLHEKHMANPQLVQELSKHIKEKMSERLFRRKEESSNTKASTADCQTTITDLLKQCETLLEIVVKFQTAPITAVDDVAKCATGASATEVTCIENSGKEAQTDVENLVKQAKAAVTKIQTDVSKLSACLKT